MGSETTLEKILLLMLFTFLASTETESCFGKAQQENIKFVKTNDSFFHNCRCSTGNHSIKDLKWIDPQGNGISTLRPERKSNEYTEIGKNDARLYISSASKSNSGLYTCIITDNNGQEHRMVYNLIVYDPLHFINTNATQFIIKGNESLISCNAESQNTLKFSWYKGEDELVADQTKYITEDNKGLIVKNVMTNDSGIYRCFVTDYKTGEEIDIKIDVQVIEIPIIKEVNVIPNNIIVAGQTVTIECLANGIPDPEYRWKKKYNTGNASLSPILFNEQDQALNESLFWQQDNNIIKFDDIEPDASGTYECIAANIAGENRREVAIEVLFPPIITEFQNISVDEGSALTIVCIAIGRPIPHIHLSIVGDNLEENASVIRATNKLSDTASIYRLTFLKTSYTHAGVYYCNATNEVDYAIEQIQVNIYHKPYFDQPFDIVWGWNDKIVNLSCESVSYPPANITWRYDGNEITTKGQAEINEILSAEHPENYILLNASKADIYGDFECIAKNLYGEASKIIHVKEAFPPPPVISVDVIHKTATSVIFAIYEPEKVNGPPILGYTAQYDDETKFNFTDIHVNRTWSKDRPFKLEKLKPNVTYNIIFAAVNDVGVGSWSKVFDFTTPEKSIPGRPTWEADLGDKVLRWKTPDSNGDPIDHYLVKYCPMQNSEIQQTLCKEEIIQPTTELDLRNLSNNMTYYLNLYAHNSEGNSEPAEKYITIENGVEEADAQQSLLSAGTIIGISVVVVFVCLVVLDLILLCCSRKGVIASCCCKNKKRKNDDKLNSRDKKGLLKDGGESTAENTLSRPNNGHKEYEYNKKTGVITGKHSAV